MTRCERPPGRETPSSGLRNPATREEMSFSGSPGYSRPEADLAGEWEGAAHSEGRRASRAFRLAFSSW